MLPIIVFVTGCQSWRSGIADYAGECYDSTCHFFNEVAIDFKLKDRDKYIRQPYEDEVKINGELVEFTYSPRIGRLITLQRIEGGNMLSTLDPREEKDCLEDQKTPVYRGGVLLYDVAQGKPLPGQRYDVSRQSLRLLCNRGDASLEVAEKKPELRYSYKAGPGNGGDASVHLLFKAPQCIVFEDATGRLSGDRIIRVRPRICYYAPPEKGVSGVVKTSAAWIIILYKEDMIIISRKRFFKPGGVDYQFQIKDNKLIFDSIIPKACRDGKTQFFETWQIHFRPALYSPGGLTDFLISNHINKLK